MQTILLVIHMFIALALIALVLLQRSNNDGMGLTSGGSNNSFMSGRASANLLTRATSVLAAIFMINCLVLAYLAAHSGANDNSILNKVIEEQKSQPAAPENNGAPSVPVAK